MDAQIGAALNRVTEFNEIRRQKALRVLLVDDCHDQLEMLASVLGEWGHEVRVAHNGELALSEVSDFEPHCILLDRCMPVMDGYELAQTLRTYIYRQAVLIGVSGSAPDSAGAVGLSSVVDAWFSKPIDFEALEGYLAALPGRLR